MLSDEESIQIVVDCIRAVSHADEVDINGTLEAAEIFDADRVNSFITLVVHDRSIGVLSRLHRISSAWFRKTGPSTAVNECISIVRDRSIEVRSSFTEDFASMVANHLRLQLQDPDVDPTVSPKTKAKGQKTRAETQKEKNGGK